MHGDFQIYAKIKAEILGRTPNAVRAKLREFGINAKNFEKKLGIYIENKTIKKGVRKWQLKKNKWSKC